MGLRQDRLLPGHEVDNRVIAPVEAGAGIKLKAFGVGIDEHAGYRNEDAARDDITTTPLEANGTIGGTATIPLAIVPVGPVPVPVGVQVGFKLNIPAAVSQLAYGIRQLFSSEK